MKQVVALGFDLISHDSRLSQIENKPTAKKIFNIVIGTSFWRTKGIARILMPLKTFLHIMSIYSLMYLRHHIHTYTLAHP